MNITEALVLGVVEGLTEFLPVSSTGHMILVGQWMGIQDAPETKAFEVIVQSGAMLAVLWHYRRDLLRMLMGAVRGDRAERSRVGTIAIAFLPAAVIGLLLGKWIKAHLFGVGPVVAALVGGGVLMIALERWLARRGATQTEQDQDPGPRRGLAIGFFQCLAMWPGMSRSMVTILGGRVMGLSAVGAAGFSFLLAIPTLLAATAYDLLKHHEDFAGAHWTPLLLGTAVSFVVALLVIRVFLNFLRRHSLEVFGWYRIALGLTLWLLA